MKRLLFVFLALIIIFSHPVFASEKTYNYRETTGKTRINSEWTIKLLDTGYSIVAESSKEYHRVFCNQDYSTVSWAFKNDGLGTELLAKRDENRLIISGKSGDEEIKEEFEIDHLPSWNLLMKANSRARTKCTLLSI